MEIPRRKEAFGDIPVTWLSCDKLLVKVSWNGLMLTLAAVALAAALVDTKGLAIGVKGIAAGFRFELRESSFARLGISWSMGPLLLLLRVSNSDRSNRLFVTLFCLL